jgi:hypothetical protein
MVRVNSKSVAFLFLALGQLGASGSLGQQVKLVERAPDPHGSPRPARDARDVPLRTSLYFELGASAEANKVQDVNPDSVAVRIQAKGGDAVELLRSGRRFVEAGSGWLKTKNDLSGGKTLAVYIEPARPLQPATTYAVHVSASLEGRAGQPEDAGTWSFATEAAPSILALEFPVNLRDAPVRWHAGVNSSTCGRITNARPNSRPEPIDPARPGQTCTSIIPSTTSSGPCQSRWATTA